MKECLIGTDMCGTSMKVGAFSRDGKRLYLTQRKQIPIITDDGYFYFNKEYQEEMLYEMLKEIVDKGYRILSIGIGSCGESVYPVDKDGVVMDNAIAWYCTRTTEQLEEFRKKISDMEAFNICYLKPFYNYSAHKINWIKKYKPDIFKKAKCWLNVDGFVNYLLTGTKYIDYNQAGTTLLFDTKKRDWSDKLFEVNGLNKDIFPELIESGTFTGYLNNKSRKRINLSYRVPVSIAGHDTWCGFYALGLGTSAESEYVPNFTGTAGLTNIGTFIDKKELLSKDPNYFYDNFSWVIPHTVPNKYHCRGNNTSSYGALLEFTRKLFFEKDKKETWNDYYKSLSNSLSLAAPGANGVRVFVSENEPLGNNKLEGINFLNLKLSNSKADIYRAAIEYLCVLDKNNLGLLEKLSNKKKKILVFGGFSNDLAFMKIRASIMNRELYIPVEKEINVLGAALLGAVGAKIYDSYGEALDNIEITYKSVVEPDYKLTEIYKNIYNLE